MRAILLLISCLFLTSCMTAAVSGANIAYSHRSVQNDVENQVLQVSIYDAIKKSTAVNNPKDVGVSAVGHVVLLTGQVPDTASVNAAQQIAEQTDGVKRVVNFIEIGPPVDESTRLNDTWITTKIKTKIVTGNSVSPSDIKIITENGVVYLMGALPRDEANAAIKIAQDTDGVKKVVTVIYFLDASTS